MPGDQERKADPTGRDVRSVMAWLESASRDEALAVLNGAQLALLDRHTEQFNESRQADIAYKLGSGWGLRFITEAPPYRFKAELVGVDGADELFSAEIPVAERAH